MRATKLASKIGGWLGLLGTLSVPATSGIAATLPTTDEVKGIVALCGGGITEKAQASVSGGLDLWKQKVESDGVLSISSLATILRQRSNNDTLVEKEYGKYVACTLEQIALFIKKPSPEYDHLYALASIVSVEGGGPGSLAGFLWDGSYKLSEARHAAGDMADSFDKYIEQINHGPSYDVVLTLEDNKLVLKNADLQTAKLYVTRFDKVRSFSDLDRLIRSARASIEQTSVDYIIGERAGQFLDDDKVSRDAKLREGVYRLVIAAPGYESEVRYLQLTGGGRIEVESAGSAGRPVPIPREWTISLRHLVNPQVKVAIRPVEADRTDDAGERLYPVAKILLDSLVDRLNSKGTLRVFVTDKELTGYDAGRDKATRPLFPSTQVADFEINLHVLRDPGPISLTPR
jgi:hypothetical protein